MGAKINRTGQLGPTPCQYVTQLNVWSKHLRLTEMKFISLSPKYSCSRWWNKICWLSTLFEIVGVVQIYILPTFYTQIMKMKKKLNSKKIRLTPHPLKPLWISHCTCKLLFACMLLSMSSSVFNYIRMYEGHLESRGNSEISPSRKQDLVYFSYQYEGLYLFLQLTILSTYIILPVQSYCPL